MDVSEILEILGNESRRKILELLARKPCYVSEISYCLGMAPKAVLEHLEKLESSGLISSYQDGRRRYYFIKTKISLDITITPNIFRVELRNLNGEQPEQMKTLLEKFEEIEKFNSENLLGIMNAIREIEELKKLFARVQNSLNSKIDNMIEKMLDEVERIASNEVERLVLSAIAKGMRAIEIAESFRIPYVEVERILSSLAARGIVRKVSDRDYWIIGGEIYE